LTKEVKEINYVGLKKIGGKRYMKVWGKIKKVLTNGHKLIEYCYFERRQQEKKRTLK